MHIVTQCYWVMRPLAKAATTVENAKVGGLSLTGFVGASKANTNNGTVSVGKQGKERQIVNVGAGQIRADSTDAVNGSASMLWPQLSMQNLEHSPKLKML